MWWVKSVRRKIVAGDGAAEDANLKKGMEWADKGTSVLTNAMKNGKKERFLLNNVSWRL